MNNLPDKLDQIWNHAADRGPDVLVTLVVGFIVVEVTIAILRYLFRVSNLPIGLKRILFSLIRVFLWLILFLVIVQTLGLNSLLVAVTGSSVIVAIFLAPGLGPMVQDVIAGLSLASDRFYQPGAKVVAGDKQTEGTIETLDLRKTKIRDSKGKLHVISNSQIDRGEWVALEPNEPALKRRRRLATLLKKKR
ncbi:mechanosensitive ion channel family protein [Patescibacteria group bacterium]|nr:mechanosensitive ion channel family protein [Patescibacteria group bacterium]